MGREVEGKGEFLRFLRICVDRLSSKNFVCSFLGCGCGFSRKRKASAVLESETETTMEVDVNPLWTARKRVITDKMEHCLGKSERIQLEVTELKHYLLGPEDADICIKTFAESARDERGG